MGGIYILQLLNSMTNVAKNLDATIDQDRISPPGFKSVVRKGCNNLAQLSSINLEVLLILNLATRF